MRKKNAFPVNKFLNILDENIMQLTPAEKFVLLTLFKFANNETFECYPSRKRIERLTSLSESTVKRVVKSLSDKGLIFVKKRFTQEGDCDSNLYKICVDKMGVGSV